MSQAPTRYAILFNGPSGCGKDTAVGMAMEYLARQKHLKCMHMKMADPLKKAVHALFDVTVGPEYFEGDKKNEPNALFFGLSPREAYIQLSEEMVKPIHGEDFFGQIAARRIQRATAMNTFLFSDCGFPHEAVPIINLVGAKNVLIVQIQATRNGEKLTFAGDSRGYVGDAIKSGGPGRSPYPKVTVIDIPNFFDRMTYRLMVQGALNKFFGIGEDL
jgi:hypothetical protein